MKQFRWQIIIIFITGLIVGLLLLSEQTGFRLVSPVPARGGSYAEALIGNFQRLNPVLDYYNPADRDVNRLIYSSLIKYDEKGLPKADLAAEWGISFDGLTYNFALKENAFWHDGAPVIAEDIVFTIDLMRDPSSVYPEDLKDFWQQVDVIALEEKQLQFRLQEPFTPFIDFLNFGILPKHILSGMTYDEMVTSEFNLNPIGSGPYQFDGVITEAGEIKGVVLRVNENFYEEPAFLEEIVFRYYPTQEAGYNAYLNGGVQGVSNVSGVVLTDALNNDDLSVYSIIEPEISMILFNLNNNNVRFFQEKELRKSLLYAIDRKGILKNVYKGQGVIADVPILRNSWANFEGNQRIDQDNQRAVALLREIGFVSDQEGGEATRVRDGVRLSFSMVHPEDSYHSALATAIQSDWKKIGVEVTLIPVTYQELLLDHLQPLTYEAALVDINYYRSPDPDPYPFWDQSQQTGGQNYSQWENRVASQYLEEARVIRDVEERAKLYRNFQVIFSDEMPALPLFFPVYSFAVDSSIQGIRLGAMYDTGDRFWNVTEWFIIAQTGSEAGGE